MIYKSLRKLLLTSLVLLNVGCIYVCGDWISFEKEYRLKVDDYSQYKGALCINGTNKIDIAYNNDEPYSIKMYDTVEIGDSIIAKAFNDTIYLKRGDTLLWFKKYGITGRKTYEADLKD